MDKMDEVQNQKQIGGDDAYNLVMKKPELGHQRLLGRHTNKAKRHSKFGVLIPDEFLHTYKAQIVEKTVGEVIRVLKPQLSSSFKDPLNLEEIANHLINEQSLGGINQIEQCQDDVNGDDGAKYDDDVEGNKKRIENDEQDY